jgi:hypothetical protein
MPLTTGERRTLRGIHQLRRRIRRIEAKLGRDAPDAFRRAAMPVESSAKQIITAKGHIKTGSLRRSIHTMITAFRRTFIEVTVGTWLHYASKIEHLADGGYLFEAFEKQRAAVIRSLKRV